MVNINLSLILKASIIRRVSSMKATMKNLKLMSKLSPGFIAGHIFKGIVLSLLPFVNIIFSYLILDNLLLGKPKETIFTQVAIMISINLFLALINILLDYIIKKKSILLQYKLDEAISMKSIDIDYELQEKQEVMALISKAQAGINSSGGFDSYAKYIFQEVLKNILQIIYAIVILVGLFIVKEDLHNTGLSRFLNNPFSILIIILLIAITVTVSTMLTNKLSKVNYEATLGNIDGNRKFSYLFRINMDYDLGKDVRLYKMQDMILTVMKDKRFSVETSWGKYINFTFKMQRTMHILSHILTFASYVFVGLKALHGFISVGEVLRYVGAIVLLQGAISATFQYVVEIGLLNTYLTHYDTFLNLESKMVYGNEKVDLKDLTIEFKNVYFKYPNTTNYILKDINLKINPYDKLAIVGENGAGKTTFIKLLSRLYDPTEGEILVNGKNIKVYSKESIRDIFGIVFQDFKLFSYSIKDNITIGKEDEGVEKVLIEAGFKERLEKLPKGIDTMMFNKAANDGQEFSGGEEQKIAIARALYKNAPFVILDEPTSALDPLAEEEIYLKFNKLIENKTSIFISHRMSGCKFCDKIIVLDKGEILEVETHEGLMKNKNKYYELFSAQAKYYN